MKWVLSNQQDSLIQALTAQRLGVVLLQQKKYDAALAALDTPVDAAFAPLLMETKGDVYAAQGKNQEALKNYGQALEKMPQDSVGRELVQMKLDSLK